MAKKVKPQVGFEWDVQPYQFLRELRDNYTQTVIIATQRRAETISDEAEEWMRQNAPWQDRTEAARKGLRVKVLKDDEEVARYQAGLQAAEAQDAETLKELNELRATRRETAASRLSLYEKGTRRPILGERVKRDGQIYAKIVGYDVTPPDPRRAYRLRKGLQSQKQYRRLYRVPKGRSAVAQFEKDWKGQRSPVIRVLFRHNTRLKYVIWLEIANQGRYAIIARALQHWGGKLMGEVRSIANLMQYRERIAFGAGRTPRERFEQNSAAYEAFEGKPYRPWTPERQARRIKRRPEYDRKAYQENREYQQQLDERKAPTLKKTTTKTVETMRIYTPNTRR